MERITELLGNIANLSADELTELVTLIDEQYDTLDSNDADPTAAEVAEMDQLAAAREQAAAEGQARAQAVEEAKRKREEIRERMKNLRTPPKDDKPAEGDGATDDGSGGPAADDGTQAPEGAGDGAPAALPIAASAGAPAGGGAEMVRRMAALSGRAQPSPEANGNPRPYGVAITAAAGLPMVNRGEPITDRDQLGMLISETLSGMDTTGNTRCKQYIANLRWSYPEERQLGGNAELNSQRIEAVCGFGTPRVNSRGPNRGAIAASGGVCMPVNVDYTIPTWSSAERPLHDGLPAFQATRGGIQFVTPPDIGTADLQGTAAGAGLSTTVWTEATDASPGASTKPVWVVACGSEQTVYVNAIPTRVQFGNGTARFAPEQMAANTQQAMAITAREAELELLTLMYNASTQVKPAQYLGATRDLLTSVDLLLAQYEYSHRFGSNVAYTAVFPKWAKGVIRADMARELAHDNTGPRDVMAISDAQIEDWFAIRDINIIWTIDGLKAGTYGTGGSAITNQYFPTLTGSGNAPTWPGQVGSGAFMLAWLLYVEGTYQLLDAGKMDLGVVRDSLLDSQNNYETFSEVWESVAFRGIDSYQCQSMILPMGGSAGTVAATSYAE